ncbi:MAG: hypothetical protein HYY31_04885 [Chloroflexi bacterium]|nr:hypothetical protein [Chloroflexota bacterium]
MAEHLFPDRTDWSGWDDISSAGPSIAWLAQQRAATFTGNIVDRREFGRLWGQGI